VIRSCPTEVWQPGSAGGRAMCYAAALLIGVTATAAAPAHAQVSAGMRVQDISINAAIGLVTATAWSLVRGHGFSDGAVRGLVGGAATGVGRQVAASPFNGSGFAGREISALGISLITSTGDGHLTLSFPVGPVQLQLVDGNRFDWRVNAADAIAVAVNSVHAGTRLDARLSLSSGTFVFRDPRDSFRTSSGEAAAFEFSQSIMLGRSAFQESSHVPRVLYHENVHVLQDDYLADAVTNPIERAWLSRTRIGKLFTRHFDLGLLSLPINGAANSVIPYAARPWEREAYALTPLHNY
jgi:hypothetical protein